MPRIPKWLGNTMEVVFHGMYHDVEVTNVTRLGDELKKITLTGDFSKVNYTPGNVIEFRITDTDFRHYTISHFSAADQLCETLIYLHGKGIGSEWVQGIRAGDRLKMVGPGGKIRYNRLHRQHFVFGDDSSWSLFCAMQREAERRQQTCLCLAELDDAHRGWPELPHLPEMVEKSMDLPARDAVQNLSLRGDSWWKQWQNDATFYLTGRAKSIQAVRKMLITKGISMKNIQTEPYWAEGKKGL